MTTLSTEQLAALPGLTVVAVGEGFKAKDFPKGPGVILSGDISAVKAAARMLGDEMAVISKATLAALAEDASKAAEQSWRPIQTAFPFDRILVAGWQDEAPTCSGYWWKHEDHTDESGVPMEHPDALLWMPWPASPDQLHEPSRAVRAALTGIRSVEGE